MMGMRERGFDFCETGRVVSKLVSHYCTIANLRLSLHLTDFFIFITAYGGCLNASMKQF